MCVNSDGIIRVIRVPPQAARANKGVNVMRGLESVRRNYFYDDWDEIAASVDKAEGLHPLPAADEQVARARRYRAELLRQGAFFKVPRTINWRVPPEPGAPAAIDIQNLLHLGRVVDALLSAVDRHLHRSSFLRQALGFPPIPEELDLLRHQTGGLDFFRLDLVPDRDGQLKLLEIQVVMGGLGITQALRCAYGPHPELPGTAPAYEEAVLAGYAGWVRNHGQRPPPTPLAAVLGSRLSSYRHDHLVLARHLEQMELAIAPLGRLTVDTEGHLILPDGRKPDIVHRLFRSPSLFSSAPRRAHQILRGVVNNRFYLVNPWKDVLEDKRILTLVHHPRTPQELGRELSPQTLAFLQDHVPSTRSAAPETLADLLDRPRSERAFYLKKGRSFESRELWDGQQVSLRQWRAVCLRARREGDWILQDAVRGDPRPFRYLDPTTQRIRTMRGYVRVSPFYFRRADGEIRMGDVLLTAREERSRVHGASDAVLVVPR
jgi:hypothetical protein